ncbi:hypothetical protein AMELA_G00227380 [Ameiurus melas]|uniref:XPG N-terminal domain-containing protein n=1 Tax=Ameiurus melas TaxID=219545 RepID=A0A7J6A052_AMEME|nr:hypothetical protein AMELA_G00227380 [Ameiurus melas]
MGVHGLHGYIESNSDFLKTSFFRKSKLIIDGCNLHYCLYFMSHLDQAHSGDYKDFEKIVTLFFKNLRLCDIEPYVVLDGGTDVSDKKYETLKKRYQEKIRRANALSRGRSGDVLPILTPNVFKQILQKLGIPFIQCLAEADWEVAALANEWACPVLSNDSDFYIFGNRGGFLPFSHFQWRKGMAEYRLNPSSIAQFFISGEPPIRPPGLLQNLPDWSLKPLAEGKLAPYIIDVLTLQRLMMNIQVEDFGLSSSRETSRPIRQVTYGVLLCTRWKKVGKRSRSSGENQQFYVEEYDRQETTLSSSMVPAVLPTRVVTHLHLDSLWEVPQHSRLQVVLEALDVSPVADSFHVPEGLQLAVYVTCFWLKHAKPEPRAEMFWALLTGLVYTHLCREKQSEEEIEPVISRFKKLQSRKGKKTVDLELAHAYCQWQSCLNDSFNLNQLLNNPVPEPELAWLFCGSSVHGVSHELKRGLEPESLLAGAPVAIGLYRTLAAAVERELDDDFVTRIRTRTWPVERLSEEFTHLMDEDEDPYAMKKKKEKKKRKTTTSKESISGRTRHRTKWRTSNPTAPK